MSKSKFTTEFKERAVRLVLEQGLKAKLVAEELGIPAFILDNGNENTC